MWPTRRDAACRSRKVWLSSRLGLDHRAAFEALEGSANHCVQDAVVAYGGTISAEQGRGVLRRDEAARYKSPVERQLMRAIKDTLDPLGIMNPGKLPPPSTGSFG